jgi:hypothetical protein
MKRRPGEVTTVDIPAGDDRNLLSGCELCSESLCFLVSIFVGSKVDYSGVNMFSNSQNSHRDYHFQKTKEMKRTDW